MFQVSRRGENRIDIDFSGKLDSQAMRAALDDLLFKSEGISHGRMLYRIGDFDLPTLVPSAWARHASPQLLRFIRRFDRCAVIAGKEWLRKASEVEGALIPGLTIKAFDLHQEAEAPRLARTQLTERTDLWNEWHAVGCCRTQTPTARRTDMGLFDSIKAKLGLGDVSNEAERKADTPPADATHSSAEGITLSERPSTTTNATLGPDRI